MATEHLDADQDADVTRAAELLKRGRVVAFPTETVYGLGVRADSREALARLRRVKQRPVGKKFALLVASLEQAASWGELNGAARRLAEHFWPGPLTLVVPDGKGGDVGLRCPDCAVTRRLVGLTGVPVAAPSANLSGQPPACSAQEVLDVFGGHSGQADQPPGHRAIRAAQPH
ncbi:MAG: L-threonylcarbamoyladenylate synthase, partial [Candidatus Brocadiia bacterium]